MDYSKSLPSPDHPGFPGNLKPVRRRLQKLTPKTKLFGVKRGSHDSGISTGDSPAAPREMTSVGTGGTLSGGLGYNPFAGEEPVISLPPDLSDSKWLDYIERSGLMYQEPTITEDVPKPMRKRPPPIIPELAHLARVNEARPSLDSQSSGSIPNSASTASTMRRQAKTPVFRIGQLEGETHFGGGKITPFGRDPWIAGKTSSVELIADQYCALLEHRDRLEAERQEQLEREREERENDAASSIYTSSSSVYTAYQSEPAISRPYSPVELPRETLTRHSFEDTPVNIILEPVRNSTIMAQQSPTSTDGTYVGCDESAIYFKPSFSHTPPMQTYQSTDQLVPPSSISTRSHAQDTADALSFRICLDLLTRELSSAFADRASQTGDASALQVWVMIEAYERLQNRIACSDELSELHKRNMQMVFRSWLSTLYTVHDMMSAKPSMNEREMDGLTEALD